MIEAGPPGREHVVAASPARTHRPVPGQGQARLLAQCLVPLPGANRPLGVRLFGQQHAVVGEGAARLSSRSWPGDIASPAGARRIGSRHRLPRPATPRYGAGRPTAGPRRRDRSSASALRAIDSAFDNARAAARGSRRGNSSSTRIPADPPTGADEDELAQAAGARPRPLADHAAVRGDAKPAEQGNLHRLTHWRVPRGSRDHSSIIPAG